MTLKMYIESRVRAQNDGLKKFYKNLSQKIDHIICRGVKITKKCQKMSFFSIFDHFGGPETHKRGEFLQKMII